MKKYITYAMTALFSTIAVSIAAPDKDAMMANETAAWQAFKDKKSDDYKKLLHADYMAVYRDGVLTRQKDVDSISTVNLKSFSFSDFNVVFPDPDTATTTYKVAVEGTAAGKDISGNYNAGSVWKKQSGRWVNIFHAEVPEDKPEIK